MSFVGNKDVNEKILQELNDEDLANFCKSGVGKDICDNDDFWKRRTFKRFSEVFSNKELNKYHRESQLSWRNYYISLVDFLESSYDFSIKGSERKDLKKLGQYIYDNTNEKIIEFNWDDPNSIDKFLSYDLINPNLIFNDIYEIGYLETNKQVAKEILKRLVESGDPRLKQKWIDHFKNTVISYENEEGRDPSELLVYIKPLADKRNVVLNEIITLLSSPEARTYSMDTLNQVLSLLKR